MLVMRAPTWSAGTPSGIGCVGDGDGLGLGQSSGVNAPVVVKNRNAATPAAAATSSHLERRTRMVTSTPRGGTGTTRRIWRTPRWRLLRRRARPFAWSPPDVVDDVRPEPEEQAEQGDGDDAADDGDVAAEWLLEPPELCGQGVVGPVGDERPGFGDTEHEDDPREPVEGHPVPSTEHGGAVCARAGLSRATVRGRTLRLGRRATR